MKTKNLNVKVPIDLHKAAKKKAKEKDITISQVVRRALREFVENDDECQMVHGEEPTWSAGS
jgi:predicted HicB family RNase H-like nuclease